ncbi:MAG: prepilin-type N-terminal cleavage/methylation domain-containing protein [Acidobacteria bacterium]|nr:prepilin-type N-terminal cleavage/methylation domain-containing protein [Acidobacteriota bacterium]
MPHAKQFNRRDTASRQCSRAYRVVRGRKEQDGPDRQAGRSRGQRGFTLMEIVFSTSLLGVAVLGLAMSIPIATQTNHRNRVDAEGAMLVQRQVEQMIAQPLTATTFTDVNGNVVSLAPGGSPLAGGKINFSAAAVNGYNLAATGSSGAQYQLRWNVTSLADGGKQFTIAARKRGSEGFLLPPVNLSVRQGK